MADGHPDLQGIWLNNAATPLERPAALEGRSRLTDDEVSELQRRAAVLLADDRNDIAVADNLFLAVLANVGRYKNPNATGAASDMIEREFENRTSLIVSPADGRIPWTASGKRRNDAAAAARRAETPEGPEDLTTDMRCLTYGVPRLGFNNFNSAGPLGYHQIVQAPGYVLLLYEAIHEARIIALDRRSHLPGSIRLWNGDSIGRWDSDTLVVDTTNFTPRQNVLGSGADLHLVERFTRAAADRIDYELTLSDPSALTTPLTVLLHLKRSAEPIYEYACHEGNAEIVRGVLAGARATEQAAAAAPPALDFEYFKTKVQPIFLAKRPGHARCVSCHASGTPLRLQALSPGATTWNDEQSRKNFEAVKRVVVPGSAKSMLLVHPLAEQAGGDFFHNGGKHWNSQNDPEWQTLKAWVLGTPRS
jgi:hypothetical protein